MANAKVWGISAKNSQQKLALEALMNPEIELVVLSGCAGTGKTLLALAAGLEQVIENKLYKDIMFTRAPVAVGDDLGFLPGSIEDKLFPWCGALYDNLEFLVGAADSLTDSMVKNKIKMIAMQHMRGRSLCKRYLIIDELQNISKEQLKVLLTRAGEDTKIICLGDISQIDNKKLHSNNNALSFLINLEISQPFIQHVHLLEGERSQLCKWASDNL